MTDKDRMNLLTRYGQFDIAKLCADAWLSAPTPMGTKYKVEDHVLFKEKEYVVIGVNRVSETVVEYALDGYRFLVWEEQLKEVTH